jgi:hypothetical protein
LAPPPLGFRACPGLSNAQGAKGLHQRVAHLGVDDLLARLVCHSPRHYLLSLDWQYRQCHSRSVALSRFQPGRVLGDTLHLPSSFDAMIVLVAAVVLSEYATSTQRGMGATNDAIWSTINLERITATKTNDSVVPTDYTTRGQ